MHEAATRIAQLDSLVVGDLADAQSAVVLLHGYAMQPADLAPFAHSLRLPRTCFIFPQGPVSLAHGGRAWWAIDTAAHARSTHGAPRDLAQAFPAGRPAARTALRELVAAVRRQMGAGSLLLAGFSQGGMLACDALLMDGLEADALAMLSASRLALHEWQAGQWRLRGRRVFVSHGRADPDLSFAAGERLQAFLRDAGSHVTWVPFGGGHEIPFAVWRAFRSFISSLLDEACLVREGRQRCGAA